MTDFKPLEQEAKRRMSLRQKFFALAGAVGVLMAIVSIIGYFTAARSLENAVEEEIVSEIGRQSAQADGWLLSKAKIGEGVATQLSRLTAAQEALARSPELVAAVMNDKEITNLMNAMEDGFCISSAGGNQTGKADWTKRAWYVKAKQAGKFDADHAYPKNMESWATRMCK